MIAINGVTKTIENGGEKQTLLDNISMNVKKTEFVAICGSSGSGKSTLLSVMSGIDKPNKGKVIIDDIDIYDLNNSQLAKFRNENIGIVFQNFNLISSLSVLENVEVPLYLAKMKNKSRKNAAELLEILGLKNKKTSKVGNLSGGEQQRVAIARALIQNPKIIFADEPTGALDYETGNLILDLLKEIRDEYFLTIVLVTHEKYIAELADRTLILKKNRIYSDHL